MREHLLRALFAEMESTLIQTKIYLEDHLKMANRMEKEDFNIKMAIVIEELLKTGCNKEMVF